MTYIPPAGDWFKDQLVQAHSRLGTTSVRQINKSFDTVNGWTLGTSAAIQTGADWHMGAIGNGTNSPTRGTSSLLVGNLPFFIAFYAAMNSSGFSGSNNAHVGIIDTGLSTFQASIGVFWGTSTTKYAAGGNNHTNVTSTINIDANPHTFRVWYTGAAASAVFYQVDSETPISSTITSTPLSALRMFAMVHGTTANRTLCESMTIVRPQ